MVTPGVKPSSISRLAKPVRSAPLLPEGVPACPTHHSCATRISQDGDDDHDHDDHGGAVITQVHTVLASMVC